MGDYTKGDWYASQVGDGTIATRVEDEHIFERIATIFNDQPKNLANAHLIAASPLLYKALQAANTVLHNQLRCESDEGLRLHIKRVINQSDTAIAKAEGK